MLAGACLFGAADVAFAQVQLPEGKGRDETVKVCGVCHPAERGAAVRLTRDGWKDVISKMVSLGAKGTDPELEAVLDYLSTHFKGDAARPLNLNSASALDLESGGGPAAQGSGGVDRPAREDAVQDPRRSEEVQGPRLQEDRSASRSPGLFLTFKKASGYGLLTASLETCRTARAAPFSNAPTLSPQEGAALSRAAQSCRSAISGAMRLARRAGSQPAAKAATASARRRSPGSWRLPA